MAARWRKVWVLVGAILLVIVAGSGAASAEVFDGHTLQVASCVANPTTVEPGETVTLDASDSEGNFVEFDVEGTGEYERGDETDFIVNVSYADSGTYDPVARVDGEDTDPCGTIIVNEPPTPALTISPNPATTGEAVTFDASRSTDPDGQIEEYRWDFDGDGRVERTTNESDAQYIFPQSDLYVAQVTVVDDDGATSTIEEEVLVEPAPPEAACSVEPTSVQVGDSVRIDASGTENAMAVEFDVDGDGEPEAARESPDEFVIDFEYDQSGTYDPSVTAIGEYGDRTDTADCPDITVSDNEPPIPRFSFSPDSPTVGEEITFDASASEDPDGRIIEYRWDFDDDGTPEVTTTNETVPWPYDSEGVKVVTLTVEDNDGATARTELDLFVEPLPPDAACRVEVDAVETNSSVVIDASETENADRVEFYIEGKDDPLAVREAPDDFIVETSFEESGSVSVHVVAYSEDGEAVSEAPCGSFDVTGDGGGEDDDPPLEMILIFGGGALGIGALYYFFWGGGIGGGGGGATGRPRPPRHSSSEDSPRYETGVFEVPSTSGTLTISGIGFQPDLLVFRATNGHRSDAARDRTSGWSYGSAVLDNDDIDHRAVTVADDDRSTDQATCATTAEAAVDLVRHGDGVPGRIRCRVTDTTSDGFELDVTVPGDDPMAGGIRVCYQAIRTGSAEVEIGEFLTPTEPGTQTVDLDLEADFLELVGSAAVSSVDQTFTTDRGVGLTVGRAVTPPDGALESTAHSESTWPSDLMARAAACDTDRALHLLYQDAEQLAGRTTATVTSLGPEVRLRYDRVYSGPHKLGSVARHPVTYLAIEGGDSLRPAVGTTTLPRPGEQLTIDIGFEPAMVEFELVDAGPGEEVPEGVGHQAFGWSLGTAIYKDDTLRQYVLHDAAAPAPGTSEANRGVGSLDAITGGDVNGETGAAAATDGGQSPDESQTVSEVPDATAVEDGVETRQGRGENSISSGTSGEQGPAERDSIPLPSEGPDPSTTTVAGKRDDGIALTWLVTDGGAIVGRDELIVEGLTEEGIEGIVRTVSTDRRDPQDDRPTVIYRAWPAADAERETESMDDA